MAALDFTIKWSNDLAKLIEEAGLKAPYAIAKALDEVGGKTATMVIRSTAAQAGVPYARAKEVISTRQAMGGGAGEYVITARDVTLSLKQFGARPGTAGVSAAPWHRRLTFDHTFIGPGGHVFVRKIQKDGAKADGVRAGFLNVGRRYGRLPVHKLFGPSIPKEMTKDRAEQTFYAVTQQLLPYTLEKWLLKMKPSGQARIRSSAAIRHCAPTTASPVVPLSLIHSASSQTTASQGPLHLCPLAHGSQAARGGTPHNPELRLSRRALSPVGGHGRAPARGTLHPTRVCAATSRVLPGGVPPKRGTAPRDLSGAGGRKNAFSLSFGGQK
jgi:hypothetical protein